MYKALVNRQLVAQGSLVKSERESTNDTDEDE